MATVRTNAVCLLSLVLVAGIGQRAAAQMQIPDKFENLQVLPKDIPKDTLVAIMRGFTGALGVRCGYCHVERGDATAGGPTQFNFPLDDKDHKKTARVMLRMVDSINTKFLVMIPDRDNPPTNVNCMTCHRGSSKPTTIETVLLNTTARSGIDSAIARYRTLRNDMASGRFNFSEQPVSDAAQRLATQGKYDEAIKLLQMNQEFYPNSADIDFRLAETYIAKGDRDAGIARLRAVLAKNPNDRRARARLQQLGVQP